MTHHVQESLRMRTCPFNRTAVTQRTGTFDIRTPLAFLSVIVVWHVWRHDQTDVDQILVHRFVDAAGRRRRAWPYLSSVTRAGQL